MDKRIFKAKEIDSNKKGWVVDLSGPDAVNPDCYWYFSSQRKAAAFLEMVDNGTPANDASYIVTKPGAPAGNTNAVRKDGQPRELLNVRVEQSTHIWLQAQADKTTGGNIGRWLDNLAASA
jgi:hypothetical protein